MQTQRDIYNISRLNSELRQVIEGSFPLIWVEGEISNLSKPRSGHLYFSLKDNHAQIRCALFRAKRNLLRFEPNDGNKVIARVRIALYEPRGDCQLIVEHMEPAGDGLLQAQFEQLKQKLHNEGLFDNENKRELPQFPDNIGLITSPSGAAIRDVLQILARRYPSAKVTIYPSAVQGGQAADELRTALQTALMRKECDVLILTRGGGSLEDLAAFNDEQLARQIAQSHIPIISAVGHEIDFTIADFVADRRAPTPSAAAELVSPDQETLLRAFQLQENLLQQTFQRQLQRGIDLVTQASSRLQRLHPGVRLRQQQQRLDELETRLARQFRSRIDLMKGKLHEQQHRLQTQHPAAQLTHYSDRLTSADVRLRRGIQRELRNLQEKLGAQARQLQTVSPLATLDRGYSIALDENDKVISATAEVKVGENLEIRLKDGKISTEVKAIYPS